MSDSMDSIFTGRENSWLWCSCICALDVCAAHCGRFLLASSSQCSPMACKLRSTNLKTPAAAGRASNKYLTNLSAMTARPARNLERTSISPDSSIWDTPSRPQHLNQRRIHWNCRRHGWEVQDLCLGTLRGTHIWQNSTVAQQSSKSPYQTISQAGETLSFLSAKRPPCFPDWTTDSAKAYTRPSKNRRETSNETFPWKASGFHWASIRRYEAKLKAQPETKDAKS